MGDFKTIHEKCLLAMKIFYKRLVFMKNIVYFCGLICTYERSKGIEHT